MWLQDGVQIAANEPEYRSVGDDKPKPKSDIQIYHCHNDHLGTPNELTTHEGEVVWLADYEAYRNTAKVVWREEQLGQIQVSAEELKPIRFQGQSFDTETGLHYNRFRYFDPDLGMFTTRDPIGLLGGSNVFQYAPNPTGWIDPFGLNNVQTGAGRDHVTYRGTRNGKSYTGYASAPSSMSLTSDEIISRRYNGNFNTFGGQAPRPIYSGSGIDGKQTDRGLEQYHFEQDVKNLGRENVDNRQNPVGPNNANKENYEGAADKHNNPSSNRNHKPKC